MIRKMMLVGAMVGVVHSLAAAQEAQKPPDPVLLMPMFSVDAYEVNGVAIPNGPASKITIAPGDVVTAKIMIRNFSPYGQKLRAYQAQMNPDGYKSGTKGTLQPVGHNPGTNNDANAFIDQKDPNYIHKGLASIPLVDSAKEGYRWLNVLLNYEESPVSTQDSKKFSCGTVKLVASPDAEGVFKISLVEEGFASGILDPANEPIVPLGFEPLMVEVKSGVKWLRIESSDPVNGSVDGRITPGKSEPVWNSVVLQFNGVVGNATAADFEVQDGSNSPPTISKVEVSDAQVLITLDKGIRAGAWTMIKHRASSSVTRIGRLAGDVSSDGRCDANDLAALIDGLNGAAKLTSYQADLDGDGTIGIRDSLRMIDLLTAKRMRNDGRLSQSVP